MDVIAEVRDVMATMKPITPEQRERLKYWDYFTYWVGEAVTKQQREREKEAGRA